MRLAFALLAGIALPSLAWAQEVPAIQATAASQASVSTALRPAAPVATVNVPADGQTSGGMKVETIPSGMPPAMPRLLSPDRPLPRKARVAVTVSNRWRNRVQRPALGPDGQLRFVFGEGEPGVVCSPLHVCDIALQPGETVIGQPFIGSPQWIVHPAVSGLGRERTTHVIVKPTDAGLDSNIQIATDRRMYSIQLLSRASEYMPSVGFTYPNDGTASWTSTYAAALAPQNGGGACDQPPVIPPSAYRITVTDGSPGWTPVQAYAVQTPVGMKTCVEFRADIGSTNLPALLLLGNDGGWFSSPTTMVVNYSYQHRRFIVDELVNRAELVNGVEGERQRVRIVREAAQ